MTIQDLGTCVRRLRRSKNVLILNGVTEISNVTFSGCLSLERISLADIYYGGAEDRWKAIKISNDCNDALFSATIYCNSAGSQTQATVRTEQPVAYANEAGIFIQTDTPYTDAD